jgi:hypothetical protein
MATTIEYGDAAISMFYNYLTRAFDEDALGGVYAYQRIPINQQRIEKIENGNDPSLISYKEIKENFNNLIIIDSGNSDGDLWQCIFHVKLQICIFIYEA